MWLSVVLAVTGLLSALGAVLLWLETRVGRKRAGAEDQVKHQIADALTPVTSQLSLLTQKLDTHIAGEGEAIRSAVERGMQPLVTQLGVLETKVQVFWQNVALSSAHVIHQPDPRRAHIDELIDAFTDYVRHGAPALTPEQTAELRGYLEQIASWEPGQVVGFPVVQGEQASAVQLLHTMEHAHPGGGK